jgi:hypothetical protein
MKKIIFLLLAYPAFIFAQDAETEVKPSPKKISVILKIGTTGLSPEVSYQFKPKINFRGSVSFFNYNRNGTRTFDQGSNREKGKVAYDAKARIGYVGLMVDYYPFKKFLGISAGAFYNLNSIDVKFIPKSSVSFGDRVFTPEETGTMDLKMKYNKIAPYLGISLGNPSNGKFRVLFDLGVLYTGSPIITLVGTGLIQPSANQAPQVQANLKPLFLYPVAKLGVSYGISK